MPFSTQLKAGRGRYRWLLTACLAGVIAFAAFIHPDGLARAQTPPPVPSTEEQREAEAQAAWDAAFGAAVPAPQQVALLDQGSFSVPEGYFFIPKAEGTRLMRAWGNMANGKTFQGLIAGRRAEDQWIAEIAFIKEGYVKDDEAKNWDADNLLTNLKEGTEEANADRRERGFPEIEVIGWVEKPAYDAATHRLVWSASSRRKDAAPGAPQTVNYNTYLLGREGYFALDFITGADRIEAEKPIARDLLAHLAFVQGKRYEDFSTDAGDKVATYGIAALVGGLAAKKLGLLALAAAFALKFAKVIAVGAIGVVALIGRIFKGRGGTKA
jgi:uncharacterized membrane-anchored protein